MAIFIFRQTVTPAPDRENSVADTTGGRITNTMIRAASAGESIRTKKVVLILLNKINKPEINNSCLSGCRIIPQRFQRTHWQEENQDKEGLTILLVSGHHQATGLFYGGQDRAGTGLTRLLSGQMIISQGRNIVNILLVVYQVAGSYPRGSSGHIGRKRIRTKKV